AGCSSVLPVVGSRPPPPTHTSVCRSPPPRSRLGTSSTREPTMSDVVRYEVRDRVAVATIDNGKANVLSPEVIAGLDDALSAAEAAGAEQVGALVVTGKPGFLSGGFDLAVMGSSAQAAGDLVTAGGALFTRMFGSAVPVVVACPGHAVAAGALLLLGADER